MKYVSPNQPGSKVTFKSRYGNYINGEFVPPTNGRYFDNPSPVTGRAFCEIPRSDAADIEKALDAAHAAKDAWGRTAPAERSLLLNRIADRIEENLEVLAVADTWDNGKPVRETLAADLPLVVDHLRYFAGAIRSQEGSLSVIDDNTVAYHFQDFLRTLLEERGMHVGIFIKKPVDTLVDYHRQPH